jgi:hypothetical protein
VETYSIETRCAVFFGQASDLQCDLDEGAGDGAHEDEGAERRMEKGFEMALSRAWVSRQHASYSDHV